ncbi:hypothetical protein GMES_4169 [Paraglaciecola mesophila KMM 241]|uniref:Uncharacterized protein n=1 Tax=Paraglaciecola mesophila KMM 241 TaxID=1128912 RepID=K6Z7U3_9ALTE|nr:hypothetical protein GMES_4169 [Paraglaciecola mesophila KMM 241]
MKILSVMAVKVYLRIFIFIYWRNKLHYRNKKLADWRVLFYMQTVV